MILLKKTFLIFILILFWNGCARDNAVAMNLYQPNNKEEKVSSISVEITQEMIDKARRDLKESGEL